VIKSDLRQTGRWFFPGFSSLTKVTSIIHFVVENRVILFNSNRDILLFDRILEQYDYYISWKPHVQTIRKVQVCFPVYQLTMYNIDVIIYTVINNYQGRNCGFESEEAVENWDLTAQNNALWDYGYRN
jgi:hypothetical protein